MGSMVLTPFSPTKDARINAVLKKTDEFLNNLRNAYEENCMQSGDNNMVDLLMNLKDLSESFFKGFDSMNGEKKIRAMFIVSLLQVLAVGGVCKHSDKSKNFEIKELLKKIGIEN